MSADLLDASVWLASSVADHVHHRQAARYWEQNAGETVDFCRLTLLALARHLTTAAIMGERRLTATEAWRGLEGWLALPHMRLREEPAGVDEMLRSWSTSLDLRAGAWTDAYLAAFAIAAGSRLVTLDRGFHRFPGLAYVCLGPS